MIDKRLSLSDYMLDRLASGQIVFSQKDALAALGVSPGAFLQAAARQQRRKALLNPRQGFYVVVPPQYLSWGAPPPAWYIDDLMRQEERPYYVGLLKAAELHGATHQAVMEFQVITDKRLPKIRAGRSIISFFYRKDMASIANAVVDQKTDTGRMRVSSPELTALDLLRYTHNVGSIDAIATVLADLGDKIVSEKLVALAPVFERSVIQRLGYLLNRVGHAEQATGLHGSLSQFKPLPWVELEPGRRGDTQTSSPLEKNSRWHVVVRHLPEIDE